MVFATGESEDATPRARVLFFQINDGRRFYFYFLHLQNALHDILIEYICTEMHFSQPLPRFLDRKKVHKLSRKLGNRKGNSARQGISTSKKPLSNETPEVHEIAHALAIFNALSIVDRMTKKYLLHV